MSYSSKIANTILVTPYDNRANVSDDILQKMSEKEFCEYCYSKPKFLRNTSFEKESDEGGEKEYPISKQDLSEQIYNQQCAYDNYSVWRDSFRNPKVYTVSGNAGTGKTTFINYERYTNKKIEWIILDIYYAPAHIEWISDIRTNICNFNKAQSKVYGCIVDKIQQIIFHQLDDTGFFSIEKVYDCLHFISDNYKNRWRKYYPAGKELMEQIVKIIDTENTNVEKVEECAKRFKEYFNGNTGPNAEGTIKALNFMLLTILCNDFKNEKKYIIAFDNFERFIGKNEIYNRDVDKVRLLLNDYADQIMRASNIFSGKFKFLMAVRDRTSRMCSVTIHAADTEPNNLNLNDWYDVENIIDLKKLWYKKENIIVENVDLVEQITGDIRTFPDKTVTGLKLILEPLFNNNKRLLIDFIGRMVEHPSNEKIIKSYIKLWQENTQQSRFGARSIIRGLVLYRIEQEGDHLFQHLKTYNDNRNINGLGEARKILTILYNNVESGEENEMPISVLFTHLFNTSDIKLYWNENHSRRKLICEILFYMNSYNRRENDWIQFIEIQYKNDKQAIDYSIAIESADNLEQVLNNDMNNCTVHLMPAGRVYLERIVAHFEFFSLRYVNNYTPLFSLIPTPEEMEKCQNVENLQCFKVIGKVVVSALKCIRELKKGEDTIKLYRKNKDEGRWHYSNIINQHTSYIDSFISYIQIRYIDDKNHEISDSIKSKYKLLCNKVLILKQKYN